jgi:dipeptidase
MFPRPDYSEATYAAAKFIDRSFIKLQKVSMTYNLTKLVKPWGINQFTVSLSADNLLTYAPHWKGLDPETNNGLTDSAVPSIRTYLLTFSLNF